MRIDSSLVCMTKSTVYELLLISDVPLGVRIAPLIALKEGAPSLPFHLFEYDCVGGQQRLVAAYRNVSTPSTFYILGAFDDNDALLDRQEVHVNCKRASLTSIINRRMREEGCSAIERADARSREHLESSLELLVAVSEQSHLILKFRLTLPDLSHRGDVSIVAIGDDLSWSTSDFTVLSEVSASPSVEGAPRLLRMGFSVNIPWDQDGVSLVAFSTRTSEILHFEHVSRETRDAMQAQTDRLLRRHAELDPYYNEWFCHHRVKRSELELQRRYPLPAGPRFSVVVPLVCPLPSSFQETIQSVLDQSYTRWELVLIVSDSSCEMPRQVAALAEERSARVKVVHPDELYDVVESSGIGVDAVESKYVFVLGQKGVLEPNALYEFARVIADNPTADLLYCDEDVVGSGGTFVQPFFKPDFDCDLLRSINYIGSSFAASKALFTRLGTDLSTFDDAACYDMVLRATENASLIYHVPVVLHHRCVPGASPSEVAQRPCPAQRGLEVLRAHLGRLGLRASVSVSERNTFKVLYSVPEEKPLVSIIIPTKNNEPVLRRCIESILEKTTYQNFEVLIIDNGSTENDVEMFYAGIKDARISVWRYDAPFNFSAIVNEGVRNTRGEYLLLLNNDTEVITPDWIEIMLGNCAREEVGAVGVKLLYPDDTVQHAGVNVTGGPVHLFSHLPNGSRAYHDFSELPRNLSAVTGACMMTKRSAFASVGGFDEELAVTFNDVDYCLKLRHAGYLVVYCPFAELHHYESISRGADEDLAGRTRSLREKAVLLTRWPEPYVSDPYYSPSPRQGNPECAYYAF